MLLYDFLLKSKKYYAHYLYLILVIIPRIVVCIIFLIDVFYFQYIYYFYKSLIFIAIPLIFNFYLYVIEYTYLKCRKFFHHVVLFIPVEGKEDCFSFQWKNKEDMPKDPEDHGGFADEPTQDNLKYLSSEMEKWN
jgi:hypothetical protein